MSFRVGGLSALVFLLPALFSFASCHCDPDDLMPTHEEDAGLDAGTDAGGEDAGFDAGEDAGIDAGEDASIDAGEDAGIDAGEDAGIDAGEDAGIDAGRPCLCAGGSIALNASVMTMINEEFPDVATSTRLHVRDDARSCGGFGVVRSIVQWDLTPLSGCQLIAPTTAAFDYTLNWGYGGNARPAALHRVTSPWGGLTTWSTQPAFDPTPWATATVPAASPATVTFALPPSELQAWIDDPASNHGAILKLANEACPRPRLPAEFARPRLIISCE